MKKNILPKITLDDWQKEFLSAKGDKILCTGRQVGKSLICAIDCINYIIKNPKTQPVVMVAPTERQAYGLFQKTLNHLLETYPHLIKMGKDRPTQTRIKLKIDGYEPEIYCLPVGATGLSIRFITIGRLYVDEASRLPEAVWEALLPALLVTGADTIVLSTPFGCQGEFWRIFKNVDGAYDSFTRFECESEQVIKDRVICETWTELQREKALIKIEQAKKRMSNHQFNQEYGGKFVEYLHRWFSDELITQTCILQRRGRISDRGNYYLGMDIARMGEDEGTFEILDRQPDMIYQVENIVTRKKLTNETEDKTIELNNIWGFKKIYIDCGAGTLGVSVFDHLILLPELKKKVIAINNAKRIIEYDKNGNPRMIGLLKEDLYTNLKALMEQRRIKLLDDAEIKESLASVQYEYVIKEGEPTKLRIFGDYTHIAEGLIRACWCIRERFNNFNIYYV